MTALQEATETCLRSFEAAIDHLSGEQNPAESDDVQEELYRFRVWMENLGGQSALEWRMRDRNSIRSTTLTLLALLQRTLIRSQCRYSRAINCENTGWRNSPVYSHRCTHPF